MTLDTFRLWNLIPSLSLLSDKHRRWSFEAMEHAAEAVRDEPRDLARVERFIELQVAYFYGKLEEAR